MVVAIGVVLLGVLVIALTWTTTTPIVKDPVGPRFFPFVLGPLFIIGGSVVALQRFRTMNAEGGYRVGPGGPGRSVRSLTAGRAQNGRGDRVFAPPAYRSERGAVS